MGGCQCRSPAVPPHLWHGKPPAISNLNNVKNPGLWHAVGLVRAYRYHHHSGTSPSHSAHSRRPALESGTSLVSNNDGARSWAPGGSLLLAGGALRRPGGIPWSSRAEVPRPAHTGRVPRGAVGSRHELRERVTPRHATLLLTVYMSCACAARRQPALDCVETELRALFHACRRGLRREHGRGQPLFGANGPGVHTDGYARYVVRHRSGRGRDSGAS